MVIEGKSYERFLAEKHRVLQRVGFEVEPAQLHPSLFEFQKDVVCWALRLGRAAVFAGTGLGKTRIQVSFAEQVERREKRPVLISAPLAVAQQTVAEALTIGVRVHHVREADEVASQGIYITNYDRLDRFDLHGSANALLRPRITEIRDLPVPVIGENVICGLH